MNTFGNLLRLTTFGESHGPATGGVVDGLPPGQIISLAELRRGVRRRSPGKPGTSPRSEADRVRLLSGLLQWPSLEPLDPGGDGMVVTLGTPVGFMIENTDCRPADYEALRHLYRPSHADYAWQARYGAVRDWRGGGRSSGRETAARVVAGEFARQVLATKGIAITSRLLSVGPEEDPARFAPALAEASAAGDSLGAVVECRATGVPAGWGNPVFGKLQALLAQAMMSIGAVKAFEYGDGARAAALRGSQGADEMAAGPSGSPVYLSNHSGGIQGGISNGQPLVMRVAFKPTPTIARPLRTLTDTLRPVTFTAAGGRHDPCVALRGRVVVEAMAALTLLDAALMSAPGAFPPAQLPRSGSEKEAEGRDGL